MSSNWESLVTGELAKRGLGNHQIAAVLGSIAQESSGNPYAKEAGGTGTGLFQWSYGRAKSVPQFTGDKATDIKNQLDLFFRELEGPEKKAGQMLFGAKDLSQAAAAMKQFERYGIAGKRYDYMNQYAKRLGGGQLPAVAAQEDGPSLLSAGPQASSSSAATAAASPDNIAALSAIAGLEQRLSGADEASAKPAAAAAAPLGLAGSAIAAAIGVPQEAAKDVVQAAVSGDASSLSAAAPQPSGGASGGGEIGIVDLGKRLQALGFKVAENPAFGPVGQHSKNSHHYAGNAIDVTIQKGSPLLAGKPDSAWKDLTARKGALLKAAIPGAEIFHPGDDPVGGHHSHIHLALPSGRTKVTPQLAALLRLNA